MRLMMKRLFILILCVLMLISGTVYAADYKGASSWAAAELDKAEGYGLITDRIKDNMSAKITREEFAETAVRLYEVYTGKMPALGSVSFSDTTNAEILRAAAAGLVSGVGGGKFSPGAFITREQMASILLRTMKVISPFTDYSAGGVEKFSDDGKISSWAKDAVYFCAREAIVAGVGSNQFNPGGNATREQAVIVCLRAYEMLMGTGTDAGQAGNVKSEGTQVSGVNHIVINDEDIDSSVFKLKEIDDSIYIFLPYENFKYSFKIAYSNTHYPETNVDGDIISAVWIDDDKNPILDVRLEVGSSTAYVNGKAVDAGMSPYREGDKLLIPINLFMTAFEMETEADETSNTLYIHYKDDFPADMLAGTWSDVDTNLFVGVEDIVTGQVELSSYATSYIFNTDGTYRLRMVSSGTLQDTFISQEGRYRIMGNTIMFYDIVETLYKGNPYALVYEDKKLEKPQYSFIDDYNEESGSMEIDALWLNKK